LVRGKVEYGHINETKLMLPCVVLRIVDTRGRNHFRVPHKFHGSWKTFARIFNQCYGKYAQLLVEVETKRGDIYTSSLVPL
jgi:hypothetical protein